jgi:DNA-binding MarR family transcriptional regulator
MRIILREVSREIKELRSLKTKHMLSCSSASRITSARCNKDSHPVEAPTEFRRSVTRLAQILGASMPKGELTPTKLSALGILRREGPLSASALAARLGILPQSLTRILADLESEELVTRQRDARDGREHILEPTAKALELMRAEGIRRDTMIRETMQRALTPVEIELLFVAAKAINKLADAWVVPGKAIAKIEEGCR